MKEILLNYTTYNLWANSVVTALLSEHSVLLDIEVKSSFPSLRKTIQHVWGAEEVWYRRLHDQSLDKLPGAAGDFGEFSKHLLSRSQSFIDLVTGKDEKYFQSSISYKDIKGNAHTNAPWQMIMHCMNHGTYHRGQIITVLRELGLTTIPSTDLMAYFREKK
jgi:uncharacterized damage-inducible protein DinB